MASDARPQRSGLGFGLVVAVLIGGTVLAPGLMFVTAPALLIAGIYAMLRPGGDQAIKATGLAAVVVGALLIAVLLMGIVSVIGPVTVRYG